MLIDSHAHLSHYRFSETFPYLRYDAASGAYAVEYGDRAQLLADMARQGIAASIEPAIDLLSNEAVLQLARTHPGRVFPAVGVHPTRVANEKWSERRRLAVISALEEVVAIGETGLDYHLDRHQQHRLCQYRWFIYQILLAHRRSLPLVLHVRGAYPQALRVLKLLRPFLHGGVLHCYSDGWETARGYLSLGLYFGIGGTLLTDGAAGESLRGAVRRLPLSSLLLETDSPYVFPSCSEVGSAKLRRKVRNTPLILPAVAAKIAELKGVSPEEVAAATAENAIRLFRLNPGQSRSAQSIAKA